MNFEHHEKLIKMEDQHYVVELLFDALQNLTVSSTYYDKCSKLEILSGPIESIIFFDIDSSNIWCKILTTIINNKGESGLPCLELS